jgi:hypothetical protein
MAFASRQSYTFECGPVACGHPECPGAACRRLIISPVRAAALRVIHLGYFAISPGMRHAFVEIIILERAAAR